MKRTRLVLGLLAASAAPVVAAPLFTPAAGYVATELWSGSDGAHFAVEGDNLYVLGREQVAADQYQNVVRLHNASGTVELARSPAYSGFDYSPDAITVVNGQVYWAHVSGAGPYAANVYKSTFEAGGWTTTTVLDESAGINVFGLATDGTHVLGTGQNGAGNVAFYFDDADGYNVLVSGLGTYTGGSGFDPAGNFFAGGFDFGGDFTARTYRFTAGQVADRLSGVQPTPYSVGDATDEYLVPNNGTAVMESDGAALYGVTFNSSFSGTNPYAYETADGTSHLLGELSGAATAVASDAYYRDGGVYFLAKDDWVSGQAVIYRVTPEPASLGLLLAGLAAATARRRPARHTLVRQEGKT